MIVFTSVNDPEIAQILLTGGIGVLRTDTLYGLVALAANETSVERIYALKGRDDNKSPIVLIDGSDQLYDTPVSEAEAYLRSVWPGPVSVILPSHQAPLWIRRGNDSVAYRMPDEPTLRRLIREVGPLIAPSANPQGDVPASDVREAERYFNDQVDFYVDGGVVTNAQPSRLVMIGQNAEITRLR